MSSHKTKEWLRAYDNFRKQETEMDARQYYQGSEEWLKKDHLKKPDGTYAVVTLTISGAEIAEYKDGSKHLALSFDGKDRKLGLNVTNYRTLESMYGFETESWMGRAIIIYVDPSVSNPQGGEPGGIRIRYEPPVAATDDLDGDVPF